MNKDERIELVIACLKLAMEIGIPAVIEMVKAWDMDKVTPESVQKMIDDMVPPEDVK